MINEHKMITKEIKTNKKDDRKNIHVLKHVCISYTTHSLFHFIRIVHYCILTL